MPGAIRSRDRLIGAAEPVVARYERIAFEKDLLAPPGQPPAAFLCPGHPLLDAVLELTLERHRDLLKRGTVLVDERDPGTAPRVLFYLEHAIQDASRTRSGDRRVVSKRLLYVELAEEGQPRHLHYAPYLDYRPLTAEEPDVTAILERPECGWITGDLESTAQEHAVTHVVPEHLQEIRSARLKPDRQDRGRGKGSADQGDRLLGPPRLPAPRPGAGRPPRRQAQLGRGAPPRRCAPSPPPTEAARTPARSSACAAASGGARRRARGSARSARGHPRRAPAPPNQVRDTQESAARARAVIMETERALGFEPTDRETEHLGYDIESRVPGTGRLRFIEVKGRVHDADTITVTRNEILYSLNKPDDYRLAIVEFLDRDAHRVHYLRQPFHREPDFGANSVNYSFKDLLSRAQPPH